MDKTQTTKVIKMHTLTPAYGRDYKSKAAVLADWTADKDFRCADDSYTNCADCTRMQVQQVTVRYAKLQKSAILRNVLNVWQVS